MKRTILTTILILTLAFCLTACGCEHEWTEATCLTPKTCTLCQEIEGEALGHTWKDATCEAPKTCAACKETEGSSLGHSYGDEEMADPDFVAATATYVKTCTSCGDTIEREGALETLHDYKVLLMTPDELAERFMNKVMEIQHLLGDEQYVAFIDTETGYGNMTMYLCQRNASGTINTVGEFELLGSNRKPLQPDQHAEGGIIQRIHGTVKGNEPRALSLVSLVRTVDPTRDDYQTALNTVKGWQDTVLVDSNGAHFVPFGDFVIEILPKGYSTEITIWFN